MPNNKSTYQKFYKVSLQNVQQFIDERIAALDDCAHKLKSSDLNENDEIEVLRATSTQQLTRIRDSIDALL
jgi:hypothetical protein